MLYKGTTRVHEYAVQCTCVLLGYMSMLYMCTTRVHKYAVHVSY